MTEAGKASTTQMDPTQLPEGQPWTNTCRTCGAETQGGVDGLAAHYLTVHPDDLIHQPTD